MAETKAEFGEGPGLETGGTANLTTTARGGRGTPGRAAIAPYGSSMRAGLPTWTGRPHERRRTSAARCLLAAWLASAASTSRQTEVEPPPQSAAPTSNTDALAAGVQSQAARLRQRIAGAPAPPAPSAIPSCSPSASWRPLHVRRRADRSRYRHPMRRCPSSRARAARRRGGECERHRRTAMIRTGDELLMADRRAGARGRYRVTAVGADVVELKPRTGPSDRRYAAAALKSPAFDFRDRLRRRAAPRSPTARVVWRVRCARIRRSQVHARPTAPPGPAPQREAPDVDAVPAENRADLADDARLILVADDEQRAGPSSGASTSTPSS